MSEPVLTGAEITDALDGFCLQIARDHLALALRVGARP